LRNPRVFEESQGFEWDPKGLGGISEVLEESQGLRRDYRVLEESSHLEGFKSTKGITRFGRD